MREPEGTYPVLVRVELLWQSQSTSELSNAQVNKTFRSHLKRVELAAQSYWGKVIHRAPNGITARFNTVEAAVLGAREMHRRCSSILQPPGHRCSLQIAIHADAKLDDVGAIEAEATRLASLLGEGGIVVSAAMIDSLTPELREKLVPVIHADAWISAHTIKWEDIAAVSPAGCPMPSNISARSIGPSTVLRVGGNEYAFGEDKPVITLGRDPRSDVVINDPNASRSHCRIINQRDRCVVVDQSTNGTYITSAIGGMMMAKHEMAGLCGKGWISLGQPYDRNSRYMIEFEVIGSQP